MHEIEYLSFKEPYSEKLLKFFIESSFCLSYLVENKDDIIGFAIGLLKIDKRGHVVSIAVHPAYRNLGYGQILLNKLIESFKKYDIKRINLEVRVSNEHAINLYKKFNFKIVRIKKQYYTDGEDAYLMELNL
ncbi:MAG: ribosomal protein S18-alanine N-acetyltransferase [Candidatus Helarchaeota archaeon]